MSDRGNGFKRVQYNCPYRFKCDGYVAFSLKECADRYVWSQAGSHDLSSHIESKGILTVKQRGAVERVVQLALKFTPVCRISVRDGAFHLTSAAGKRSIGS